MSLFVNLLGPYVLFASGVEIWAPFTWDVEVDSPSTKRFDVSMATFSINPLGVGTNMSSSGQKTILP